MRWVGGLVVVLSALLPMAAAPAQDPTSAAAGGRLELAEPMPWAVVGQPVAMVLRAPENLDAAGGLSVQLHERVRSRSELARTIVGRGLRAVRGSVTVSADALQTRSDGTVVASIPTGVAPGALPLGGPGVYPVTVRRTGTRADDAAPLVTQLVLPPGSADTSPPLAVAMVADLATTPARSSATAEVVHPDELRAVQEVVTALETVPGFPLTMDVSPETVVALAFLDGEHRTLFEQIARLARSQPTLVAPFVAAAPDAFAAAGLGGDLTRQLELGDQVAREVLGVTPVTGTWTIDGPLGQPGLELLRTNGIRRVVLDAELIVPTNDRVFTLARPFELTPPDVRTGDEPDRAPVVALPVDAAIATRLRSDASPAAITTQVLAELAALWGEQPTLRRSVVVKVDRMTPPAVITQLQQALAATGFLRPMQLGSAFDAADPLVDARGDPRRIALAPAETARFADNSIASIRAVGDQLASLRSLLRPADPVLTAVESDLLRSEAAGLSAPQRAGHLADARQRVAAVVGSVTTAGAATVTLTARKGSLPLTIVNNSGTTLSVELHLRGAKVEVPGGRDVPLELPPGVSRVSIDVRTRVSGSIPLELTVTSPDGRLLLTSARYRVQSTAVSGVGVVLSAGAMLFLLIWWGRHWREHRRSNKLVDAGGASVGNEPVDGQ